MSAQIEHGTPKGAMAHYRLGEKPCDACAIAKREYASRQARIRRNRSKQSPKDIERRALLRLANRHPFEYQILLAEEQQAAKLTGR